MHTGCRESLTVSVSLLVIVPVGVVLAGFCGVMNRVHIMAVSHMGVVAGLFGIAGVVALGSPRMDSCSLHRRRVRSSRIPKKSATMAIGRCDIARCLFFGGILSRMKHCRSFQ
jgi:hypothetical protein